MERGALGHSLGRAQTPQGSQLDPPTDRWYFGGDEAALAERAKQGFRLFTGRAGCVACHKIGKNHALFTDNEFHFIGTGYRTQLLRDRARGVSAVHRLAPDLTVSADFQFVGRIYDDFFEDATGRTRREFGLLSGASLRWTPRPNIDVQGRLGVGYLDSTINTVDYVEFNATPMVTARIRF